jgi:hypothetical protein
VEEKWIIIIQRQWYQVGKSEHSSEHTVNTRERNRIDQKSIVLENISKRMVLWSPGDEGI